MTLSLSRFSSWFWNGKGKEKSTPNGCTSKSASEFGTGLGSSTKKVKKQNLKSEKERSRVEWESDFVMVPTGDDGVDDEADWCIGWLEPQGCGFENDDSFAVLVPSYSKEVVEGSNVELLAAIKDLQNEFSPESKKYMELLLSSMQNSEAGNGHLLTTTKIRASS